MSSGLSDSLTGYSDWHNISTDDVFNVLRSMPLMAPTYAFPQYSNLGISLLGHILSEYVAPVLVLIHP